MRTINYRDASYIVIGGGISGMGYEDRQPAGYSWGERASNYLSSFRWEEPEWQAGQYPPGCAAPLPIPSMD